MGFLFTRPSNFVHKFSIEWKWYNACIKCWFLYYFHLNVMFAPAFHCVLQKLHFKPQFHSIVWRTPISIALNKHNEREKKKKHLLKFFFWVSSKIFRQFSYNLMLQQKHNTSVDRYEEKNLTNLIVYRFYFHLKADLLSLLFFLMRRYKNVIH